MILRPAVGLLLGKLLGRCVKDLIGDADGLSKGEFEGMVVSIKVGPLDNVLVGIFDGLNDITVGCSEEMIKDIIDGSAERMAEGATVDNDGTSLGK